MLRFESSKCAPGEVVSLMDYASRMKAGSRNIYYLSAPRYAISKMSHISKKVHKYGDEDIKGIRIICLKNNEITNKI